MSDDIDEIVALDECFPIRPLVIWILRAPCVLKRQDAVLALHTAQVLTTVPFVFLRLRSWSPPTKLATSGSTRAHRVALCVHPSPQTHSLLLTHGHSGILPREEEEAIVAMMVEGGEGEG